MASLGDLSSPVYAAAEDLKNCPTCIGPVDGTLGSCAGLKECLSSFDDRPDHFLNPWELEETLNLDAAQRQLVEAVKSKGGEIQDEQDFYVRATLGREQDVFEFLFVPSDTTVSLRAVPTARGVFTQSRLKRTLEIMRLSLGWEEVYILRNRKRFFGVLESPFDAFGDAAPSGDDVRKIFRDCGQDCNQLLD